MECSLSTWPSITQFDDLTWMGLGDIDPLETLDQSMDSHSQFTESSFTDAVNSALPAALNSAHDTSAKLSHVKSEDFYRLTSCESLAATRWESINAVDLASVLDSFPSNNDTSTPGEEDLYDLYSESTIMQAESHIAPDVDVYMSDSMTEMHRASNVTHPSEDRSQRNDATALSSDQTSLSCTQEDVQCDISVIEDESSPSVNVNGAACGQSPQILSSNPMLIRADCGVQHTNCVDGRVGETRVTAVQPGGCYAFHSMQLSNCVDLGQGDMHVRQSFAMPHGDAIPASMIIHRSKPHQAYANPQLFGRVQVVQQTPMRSYPSIIDQQFRMADAARVTSEVKRSRAQASRARRLAASQRRAKKYPFQKLIRMSTPPASTRDKVDQNCMVPSSRPHRTMQPASQNQLSATMRLSHLPAFLPVAQSSQLALNHELFTHTNPMQSALVYHHEQMSSASHQDSLVSPSGSNALQAKHGEQHVQCLSALPSLASSQTSETNESLDTVVLTQLQSLISKMNVDTRFCIRDALYRLARSSKVRQSRSENLSGPGADSSHSEVMETNTNSIDRWIVNMLFCKQPPSFDGNSQPLLPHTPIHHTESSNTNTLMQQWNSCGSFLNLHEQPLHVVSGL